MKNRLRALAFLTIGLCLALGARAFDAELLLSPASERTVIRTALLERGRTNDVALLEAAWSDDGDRFIAVARRELDRRWDRRLAESLHRQYVLAGRTDEAAALAAERTARTATARRLAAAPRSASSDCSGRTPVVFLHGYNGAASTWSDFVREFRAAGYGADDLLVFQYYDDDDNSAGLATGLTTFGGDTDTPIEKVAARVAKNLRVWLRRRAGLADDDASHDAELAPADFVCHSMGGLVFRCLCAEHPELVRRCVDLGTPHFGQNVASSLTGYQTQQMKYGSSFLWRLAEDWHFRGKACRDMIFVVGAGTSNRLIDSDVVWDSLVCAFSATLLTQDDGAAYARRTFFVNRVHSSVFTPIYENAGLPVLDKGQEDPVFRLAYGYLNDSHYFAGGQSPSRERVMSDDGASSVRIEKVLTKVLGHGGLFVQALHPTTNRVGAVAKAVKYDPGIISPDAILASLKETTTGEKYEPDGSDSWWEHGAGDEGCTNGLVMVYGNVPVGTYRAKIEAPSRKPPAYDYPYTETVAVAGGGVRVLRTRPGGATPQSAFALADDTGRTFDVTVPNAWLAERGLAPSAEDLTGCLAAGASVQANGLTAAASHWLGLDPCDATSRLTVDGIALGAHEVRLGVRAGSRVLLPEAASGLSPTRTEAASLTIQTKSAWETAWSDVTDLHWTEGDGLWRLPRGKGAFFRVVARP